MAESAFDLAVVGGGPGGYVAAIRAAQLGLKTALVEREHLGGICLNWGCIPTKALLRSAEIYGLLHRLGEFGLAAGEVRFDLAKLVARSRAVAKRLSNGVAYLLKKNKVSVFDGEGRLSSKERLAVSKDGKELATLSAPHIILATGARARKLPGLEAGAERVWTYKEAMVPSLFPKSLLIVGSGAIGIEFASFYRSMGAEVTVVEVLDRILPLEDEEISALARKAFEKEGIKILVGAEVSGFENRDDKVSVEIKAQDKGSRIGVERVILAIGIEGNVENLGLEGTGVAVEKGHVVVDEWQRTGEPGVYAIGDLAGPPWLAHKASHEGIVCVERIAGIETEPLDRRNIPSCTYSRPQIASVGLSEKAARAEGRKVKVGHFPYAGNGKAIVLGESEGMIKTIFDGETGALLGAHMIGAEVTELIHGYTIAKGLETTEIELMRTVFPHPTLSEMMGESVLDAYGAAIHF